MRKEDKVFVNMTLSKKRRSGGKKILEDTKKVGNKHIP